jgi:O-acetyl-ADP-ribose deacetylase (regulator of RNase III)
MKYIIDNVDRILKEKDFDIFIHGCNSKGRFRSGVAGIVRKHCPEAAESYERYVRVQGVFSKLMGKLDVATIAPGKHIVNAITQEYYGYDGEKYGSYDAIDEAFRSLADREFSKGGVIYYPLIGCGLAGLKWDVVKEIIDYRLNGLDHHCIVRQEDIDKYNITDISPVSSYSMGIFDFGS